MAHVEGEILIGRPVAEVFDFVADERNEPRYNPRMLRAEKLSTGPIGVGTRFRAEMRGVDVHVALVTGHRSSLLSPPTTTRSQTPSASETPTSSLSADSQASASAGTSLRSSAALPGPSPTE
jgi:hypothetical protein